MQRRRRIRALAYISLVVTAVAWTVSSGGAPLPGAPDLSPVSAVSLVSVVVHPRRPRNNASAGRLSPPAAFNFSWQMVNESDALTGTTKRVRLFESGRMISVDRARAIECLRGRHIVYIGDSHSRASYMSLVHWLHTGGWYSEVAWEDVRQWFPHGGGLPYFQNTTRALRRHDGSSYEFCDCIFEHSEYKENRMYRDWRRGISISFLQARSPPDMHGFWPRWLSPDGCTSPAHLTGGRCKGSRQQGCEAGKCARHSNASHNFGFRNIFEQGISFPIDYFGGNGSVHTIVLNSGAWGALDGNRPHDDTYARIATAYANASALARARGVQQLVWRATMAMATGQGKCANESRMFPILRSAGWRVIDAFHPTVAMYGLPQGTFPGGYYDNSHITQAYHRGMTELYLTELLDDCL